VQDWQDSRHTSQIAWTSVWDAHNRLSLATAPEGNTVAYTYDVASNPLTVTRTPKLGSGLGTLTTTTTWHPVFNKPLTVTDPRGLVTAMTYDAVTGNLLRVVADSATLAATTRFTYNGVGQAMTVTDPAGTLTRNSYDAAGNLVTAVRDAGPGRLNLTTSWTWNARGDPLTVTDPKGNVTANTYDGGRRLLTTTAPATAAASQGLVTAFTYDPAGRVTQTQQSSRGAVLRTTSATYTPSGKTATTTDANGNVTRFAYDPLDRRTSVTDPMARVTGFTYDALSRPTATYNTAIQANPLVQQGYTQNGLRAWLKDAAGDTHTTNFAYDGFDRLATTTYPNAKTETYAYDAGGNVTTRCTRLSQPIAFTYDTLNRLSSKTLPGAATTCSTTPSGTVVNYAYDRAGRLRGVSDTSAAIASVAGTSTVFSTNYAYDPTNRLTGVSFDPAPTPTLPSAGSTVTFSHGYNAANQRSSLSVDAATPSDWINYPPASTSTTSYTANNLNQYTAVGSATPTYDDNGNLTDDGGAYKFEYDAENRLTRSKDHTTSATIGTYTFDGRGRRTSKTVSGTTTIFVTDADNREVLEYDGTTGAIQRWYVYGLGPNAVLGQMNVAAGTRSAPVPDLLGSIIGAMESSSGTLTSFAYRPYGSSSSPPGQFAYTGQRIDTESGLYYYRARQYSPTWGRFFQSDPARTKATDNLYLYVENDPLNHLDPFGLYTIQVGGSVYVNFGWFSISVSGGIVADTSGGAGLYATVGGGAATGGGFKFAGTATVTNAPQITNLTQWGTNVSGFIGLGPAASIEASRGLVNDRQEYKGLGGSLGYGFGAGVSAGPSYTWIWPYVDFGPPSASAAPPSATSTETDVIPTAGSNNPTTRDNYLALPQPSK
jgi:RHS repeat-associated protein